MKNDFWDLLTILEKKSEELRDVFGETDYLDEIIDIVWDLLLESMQAKKDENGDFYDGYSEILFHFGEGEITKEKAQLQILNLNKSL